MTNSPIENGPLVQAYHPTTFVERGVAVPFTTPVLSGTRARPGERGTELIVPSPAGGRGSYILGWNGICELCRPTVHDQALSQAIAELRSVTPGSIRRAARAVAAEGLAGRDALAAAGAADAQDSEQVLRTNFHLLMLLLTQNEPALANRTDLTESGDDTLDARAKRAIAYVAPRIGWTTDAVAAALEDMAPEFASLGIGDKPGESRMRQALARLCRMQGDMMEWGKAHRGDSADQAAMVARVAEVTIGCCQATMKGAEALTANMSELLARWARQSPEILGTISRPEWLLDGWEQICLLWSNASDDADRTGVLAEIILLVPVIPREATAWVGESIDMDPLMRFRRTIRLNEDWRSGAAVFDLIERNEQLRALAA